MHVCDNGWCRGQNTIWSANPSTFYSIGEQAMSLDIEETSCGTFMLLSSVMRYAYHALTLKVKVKKERKWNWMHVCQIV